MSDIESNVPLPAGQYVSKYPFDRMQVGESVFYPGQTSQCPPAAAMRNYMRKVEYTKRFISRTVNEGGIEGVRIWRVE